MQLLATADFEALSLLVLRFYLLLDRPVHAMLFCEAMGGWHIALLVAKVSVFFIAVLIFFFFFFISYYEIL